MERLRLLTGQAMLHEWGLYSNAQNDPCEILSAALQASEKTAAPISLRLRKRLQAHHFFHYTLLSLARQAESRTCLLYPAAPRQMTVMKGNFQLLQNEATSETLSAGARQAAGLCRLSLTSHRPALATSAG